MKEMKRDIVRATTGENIPLCTVRRLMLRNFSPGAVLIRMS